MNDPIPASASINTADDGFPLPGGRSAVKLPGDKMAVKPITVSINPDKVLKSSHPVNSRPEQVSGSSENISPKVEFTDIDTALSEYIQGLSASRKHNLHTIWNSCPYRTENSGVKITVTNKVQESLLEQEKPDFLDMIRQRTGNREIMLEVMLELPPEQSGTKYLTNKERFDAMAAQNPILNKLQDFLGLDVETPI